MVVNPPQDWQSAGECASAHPEVLDRLGVRLLREALQLLISRRQNVQSERIVDVPVGGSILFKQEISNLGGDCL